MDERELFIAELFQAHYERLFKYCLAYLGADGQDAADCMNDVFLAARKNSEKLMAHPDPLGWLYKTAGNYIRKARRRRRDRFKRSVSLELVSDLLAQEPPELFGAGLTDPEIGSIKAEILSELTESERALYRLLVEESLPIGGAAERLGISYDAARMRKSRLAVKLKALLKYHLEEMQ